MREAFKSAITTNLSDASQSEGFSGSFTPKAIAKTASFAAAEAANGIPDGGKHNDSEKKNVTACSRRGDLSQPSSIQGSLRLAGGEIDFTFVKRQSTVNSLQPNERNKKRKHREISFNSAVDLAVAALTEDYIFLRAFSLSVLRKRDKRSGGCHRLHSVPPQPWHGAGQLRAPVRSVPEESGEIYR